MIASSLVFTAVLVWAAVGDVRTRRIPNFIVAILAILGLAAAIVETPSWHGAVQALAGLLVGLLCWLPFYVFGWIGAGDVKLFSAAGAWLGPKGAVEGALVAALCGAVLAVLWMLKSHGVRQTGRTLGLATATPRILSPQRDGSGRSDRLPYGIAIALGAIVARWLPGVLLS